MKNPNKDVSTDLKLKHLTIANATHKNGMYKSNIGAKKLPKEIMKEILNAEIGLSLPLYAANKTYITNMVHSIEIKAGDTYIKDGCQLNNNIRSAGGRMVRLLINTKVVLM